MQLTRRSPPEKMGFANHFCKRAPRVDNTSPKQNAPSLVAWTFGRMTK
jgi:hypothetical protein